MADPKYTCRVHERCTWDMPGIPHKSDAQMHAEKQAETIAGYEDLRAKDPKAAEYLRTVARHLDPTIFGDQPFAHDSDSVL